MKTFFRWLLSAILLTSGTLHFVHASTFLKIMPPLIPFPAFWVAFTGICEITAALALQVPSMRTTTAWMLVIFLIAIFPANIQMAFHPHDVLGNSSFMGLSADALAWLRLPLQIPLIAWAWSYTRAPSRKRRDGGVRTLKPIC